MPTKPSVLQIPDRMNKENDQNKYIINKERWLLMVDDYLIFVSQEFGLFV